MNATQLLIPVIKMPTAPTLKEVIPVNVWKVILVMGNSTVQVQLNNLNVLLHKIAQNSHDCLEKKQVIKCEPINLLMPLKLKMRYRPI